MDMRIHRTSLHNKVGTVDRTRRVNPANQDEPEQDSRKFSDHLTFIEKKDKEKNEQDQETEPQSEQEHKEGLTKESSENKTTQKLLHSPETDKKDLGNNIDIKV